MEQFANAYSQDYTTKQEVQTNRNSNSSLSNFIGNMSKYNPMATKSDNGNDLEGNIRLADETTNLST